jgi:1,2-diacylglycerol 3-alpha-glucosyltransferase
MNIGIVTTWFPSGAGMVSKAYEMTFSKAHKVFIFARGNEDKEWNNTNVTWAKEHPCSTGIWKKDFVNWVRTNKIDIVLFNEQRYWKTVLLAKKMGIMIGAYIDYYTADTVSFFNLYDFLICNTKRHYHVFNKHPQSCYCPWGTQEDLFQPNELRINNPLTFLISSGWDGKYAKVTPWLDRRGTGQTLRAFSRLKGDCRLIILSQVPLTDCPQEWAHTVDNDSRIEFRVGTFDPVPYHEGDIYVYPSRLDGIGLTLPEALSSGLAGITTNSPPMNEFVKNGINGTLIDVNEYRGRPDGYYWAESICDDNSLLNIMQTYVSQPELALLHKKNAVSLAQKELSWENNSIFLNDWIKGLKIISDNSGSSINGVDTRIVRRYDRQKNPTPFQKILVGIRGQLKYLTGL